MVHPVLHTITDGLLINLSGDVLVEAGYVGANCRVVFIAVLLYPAPVLQHAALNGELLQKVAFHLLEGRAVLVVFSVLASLAELASLALSSFALSCFSFSTGCGSILAVFPVFT